MSDPIVVERYIDASPDETFAMLTQPERLRRWQAISASVDLRAGGAYRYTIVPGNIAEGTFTEIEPGRRLVLTWAWAGSPDSTVDPSTLVVELEPKDDGTMVRFIHDGLVGESAASHEDGWNHYLDRLAVAATAGDAGFDPWAAAPEALDHLTAAEASWAICHDVLRRVETGDRNTQTPCAEFTTHELVEHLIGSVRGLGGIAGAEVPDHLVADSDSAADGVARVVELALAAWRERGIQGDIPFGGGTAPATVPVGILSLEFLVHAWDFGQTIGVDLEVPDHLAEYVHEIATAIIQPDNRGDGKGFAAATEPLAPTPVTRLMAFTGRTA